MDYESVVQGVFQERPNRFIAHVTIHGKTEVCHVKNTGRCRELLVPGATVYLEKVKNPLRKTAYDMIAVEKGNRLINMDSQAPNHIFAQWAKEGGVPHLTFLKAEQTFGDSRLDFYLESDGKPIYAEVKGVTLEENDIARFPDAPTLRGVKHLNTLCSCVDQGMEAWAVFIIQMEKIRYFTPNDQTHPAFGEALRRAKACGVRLLALECSVTPNQIRAVKEIPIRL